MQRNKTKEKYEPPRLEEVLVPEDGGMLNNCGAWRGVWEGCACHCEQSGNSVN